MNPHPLRSPINLHQPTDHHLTRRGITSFIGLASQGAIRLAITIIIGRYAGASALGLVATGQATAQLLILLWPTTAGQAASRFLAQARGRNNHNEIDTIATHLNHRVITTALLLALISIPITLTRANDPLSATCVALFLLGIAGQQYTRGIHYGVGAVTRVVTLDCALSLFGLFGVVVAISLDITDLRLLIPPALGFLLLTAACWPWHTPHPPLPTAQTHALTREIDRFVTLGALGSLASAGLVQLSVLIASTHGHTAAGAYSAAWNLAIPLTLLSGALSLVLYPNMAEAFGRKDNTAVTTQLDRGVRGLTFLVLPLVVVASLLAPEIIQTFYGPAFTQSAPIMATLLLAVLITMIAVPCVNAITAGSRNGILYTTIASLAGLATAATVWTLSPRSWGIEAVAIGYLVGVSTTSSATIARAWQKYQMRWTAEAALVISAVMVTFLAATLTNLETLPRIGIAALIVLAWCSTHPDQTRTWAKRLQRHQR
ncbi:lipopolysaccharide biosynthesis protein [Dermatophilus congolensis]|uniref:lipopolysaccharide biosynthesis protein n=4 Tax=Dermatophilus congolensis TaxID=1863 RepID=UPI001AAF127B|nr:oligosaccharide flippase family protein [Dermatophilus congolensis]MBO3143348.1 oligosaccharide flippase family protein [Dermatophilus congolensis]MBO3152336.1 oligosaccharide flippase family protein [Dermatophilus congolensis]MBO3160653.1 oligosaccharide flippase family protein [Dermatophilus congolensis]MBO3177170.1 oligosaccharide flippase family protein [Dermatophilus congolensis]MBO3201217.1 oligosaccharide flippase family protein [Dermatophilus congolensis]